MGGFPQMQPDERDEFLAGPHIAVMATERPDGRPHLSPVWYLWDGTEFRFVIEPRSVKHHNLALRPRLSVCVDKKSWPYASVIADCDVTLRDYRLGYPSDLAQRYLEGDRLDSFLARYEGTEWVVTHAVPVSWYGHINRAG